MADVKQSKTAAAILSAAEGFDYLFGNDVAKAREVLSKDDSPFHKFGLGFTAFLEAALGVETGLMEEAARSLTLAETGAKKMIKSAKSSSEKGRFPLGVEWEILQADAIILLGLTYVLSESYVGYLQCMYALNNAHNKFTKLYKSVFPNGIDSYATPATSPAASTSSASSSSLASNGTATTLSQETINSKGFFSKWALLSHSSVSAPAPAIQPEGPVEELIVSGAAFGFGLFNLVFSLLPPKVKAVAGFLGFNSDRRLALRAIAVSANRQDVHSVFAGLTLMTYHGIVLLMSGYQADEQHILRQYRAIVEKLSSRYPNGSLWVLNQAKIKRMSYDPDGAIEILKDGLSPKHPGHFVQADALLVFELAWTLLSQRRYQEAAEMFVKMTEMNNWSHATYLMIASGCYLSLGETEKAQELLDKIPSLLDRRKLGGKDLPMEVYIRKKLDFYRRKQKRWGGDEAKYVDCIRLSPAEEFGVFWNTHPRITKEAAEAHVKDLTSFSPNVSAENTHAKLSTSKSRTDLDTEDELAVRSLLLGIIYRTVSQFQTSRDFLQDVLRRLPNVESKWLGPMAWLDLAVLDLKEAEAQDISELSSSRPIWPTVLNAASEKLEKALSLCGSHIDFSSRMENRIAFLQDEIHLKREMVKSQPVTP